MRKQYALALVASVIAVAMGSLAISPYQVSVLVGDSMQPHADSCDILIIDSTQDEYSDYTAGDWVRFHSDNINSTMIHEVKTVAVHSGDPYLLVTKGINNNAYDEAVYYRDIRGKVIGHLPTPDCGL